MLSGFNVHVECLFFHLTFWCLHLSFEDHFLALKEKILQTSASGDLLISSPLLCAPECLYFARIHETGSLYAHSSRWTAAVLRVVKP